MEDSLQSRCMVLSFLEKSTTTSSSLKRAAKEPSTILEVKVNMLKMIVMFMYDLWGEQQYFEDVQDGDIFNLENINMWKMFIVDDVDNLNFEPRGKGWVGSDVGEW